MNPHLGTPVPSQLGWIKIHLDKFYSFRETGRTAITQTKIERSSEDQNEICSGYSITAGLDKKTGVVGRKCTPCHTIQIGGHRKGIEEGIQRLPIPGPPPLGTNNQDRTLCLLEKF
jgi:hypothetical protein